MKEVFISYKSDEYALASEMKDILEKEGISCWLAPGDIRGGSSYAVEIPMAINNCKAFVLILSRKCQESRWVPKEVDTAINANKTILPYVVEDCELTDEFLFYLANVQRYEAYRDREAAREKLITDIKAILYKDMTSTDDTVNSEVITVTENSSQDKDADKEAEETKEASAVKTAEKASAVKKTEKKKESKEKKPFNFKISKKACLIACICVICLIAIFSALRVLNSVYIAEERYSRTTSAIIVDNKRISAEDMDTIKSMDNLSSIQFTGCKFEDKNLNRMFEGKELVTLTISECSLTRDQINSIDFKNMKLQNLNLSDNREFVDLSVISSMKDSLVTLNVSNTSVMDISPLSGFGKLKYFYGDNNNISDISALGGCSELVMVSLNNNKLRQFGKGFQSCEALEELYVNGNDLLNLTGLENCIQLKKLDASHNGLVSIRGLENATILEYVNLNDNKIFEVNNLTKSKDKLKELYINNNYISDMQVVSEFVNLNYLEFNKNMVEILPDMKKLKELKGVMASHNKITQVSQLESLESLMYLDLSYNKITSVGGKEGIKINSDAEAVADFSNNPIKSFNLKTDSEFSYLSLYKCTDIDLEPVYELKGKKLIMDYSDRIDFDKLSEAEFESITFSDCPKDKMVFVKEKIGDNVEFIESNNFESGINSYLSYRSK